MEYKEWLKRLKVGDQVVVRTWSWVGSTYDFKKVEKVTPTGFIRVDGILYKPHDGEARSGGSRLLDPDDRETFELTLAYSQKKFVKRTINKIQNISSNSMTYDQAVEIAKIMGWE